MAELKVMARGLLAGEGRRPVRTTGLVQSALRRQKRKDQAWEEVIWADRHRFFGQAYRAMRQALVDYARQAHRRHELPRGNLDSSDAADLREAGLLTVENLAARAAGSLERAEALFQALEDLASLYPNQHLAEIIEHACFGGLTQKEIAMLLEVDERTVRNRLTLAKSLLAGALEEVFPEIRRAMKPRTNA